ncbi:MAG: hypothetical protein ACOVLK_06885 [Terrimicrobiaceae bacterium]|jgi:hypothetical protein
MKSLATSLLTLLVLSLFHVGCEMHPASQTIKGYAEKMEKKEVKDQQQATRSEVADPDAPTYFPPKSN